jgi:hypothetical protein
MTGIGVGLLLISHLPCLNLIYSTRVLNQDFMIGLSSGSYLYFLFYLGADTSRTGCWRTAHPPETMAVRSHSPGSRMIRKGESRKAIYFAAVPAPGKNINVRWIELSGYFYYRG